MITTRNLAHAVRPMALERVHFFDGMILSADDLEVEREYHLARSRLINRAVFGCGIACGLEVERHPADDLATRFVCIRPGVAFDCRGDPLELCRPLKLDLDPDPCKPPPECICILIRRRDGDAKASEAWSCGKAAGDEPRRVREQVEIRVVECGEALDGVCRLPEPTVSYDAGDCDHDRPRPDPKDDLCSCLKACESCEECGEGWVLLACANLRQPRNDDECPGPDRARWVIEEVDLSGRKYIKPIRCHCPPEKPEKRTYPKDTPRDTGYPKQPEDSGEPKEPDYPKEPDFPKESDYPKEPKGEIPKNSYDEARNRPKSNPKRDAR